MAIEFSCEYTSSTALHIKVTGLTIGDRYRLFVQNYTGSTADGWYCMYAANSPDGVIDYRNFTGLGYNGERAVRLYHGTSGSYDAGKYYDDLPSDPYYTSKVPKYVAPVVSYTLKTIAGNGISQFKYKKNNSGTEGTITNGNSTTWNAPNKTDKLYFTSISVSSPYTYPVMATDGTNTWTVKTGSTEDDWSDHWVSTSQSSTSTRTVTVYATPQIYYKRLYQTNVGSYSSNPSDTVPQLKSGSGMKITVPVEMRSTYRPTYTGYNFTGYNVYYRNPGETTNHSVGSVDTTDSSIDVTFSKVGSYSSPNTVVFIATWKKIPTYTYKISFNANRGTGAPSAIYYPSATGETTLTSVQMAIPEEIPTRTGYKFKGWALNATTGSPIVAQPKSGYWLYSDDPQITLYAQWDQLYYGYLSYDLDGGSMMGSILDPYAGPTRSRVGSGTYEETILPVLPIKTGYTFVDWSNARGLMAANHWDPGDKIDINCNSTSSTSPTRNTIYANWVAGSQKYYGRMAFHINDGTSTIHYGTTYEVESITVGGYKRVELNYQPTRTGYTFKNYNTAADGSGTTHKLNSEYDMACNSTDKNNPTPNHLYAQWTINKYTINFNPNGGTPTPTPKKDNYNTSFSLSTYSAGVSWKNHTLIGWDTNPNATTPTFGPSATYTIKGDATLYAIWEIYEEIDLFYWHGSDTADNNYFQQNKITDGALTYTSWNALKKKVRECRDKIDGATYTYTSVSPWDEFSYREFNEVRNEIAKISGHGSLPNTVSEGVQLRSNQFNGTGSLKAAINTAINVYNGG